MALLFFEPSTRTRISFEMAAQRLGLATVLLDGGMKSSLEKGESYEDSVLNVCAMQPACAVIRCGDLLDLKELQKKTSVPLINAGWGLQGHPSQALLDFYTLFLKFKKLEKIKIVYVGDIRHSRVVASHQELAKIGGVEFRYCTPEYFLPENNQVENFASLSEACSWADVVYVLRSQFERHNSDVPFADGEEVRKYRDLYTLRSDHLRSLKSTGFFMHPGPIHHGLDLQTGVLQDPRNLVLEQVKNGVLIRMALIQMCLNGDLI